MPLLLQYHFLSSFFWMKFLLNVIIVEFCVSSFNNHFLIVVFMILTSFSFSLFVILSL
ncbi:hypothetical protein GLOIN_2v1716436 [Rhizophagus irregularis DAOM 181602=DAOM 197198]|uniref:Uncharacterized protein n=1 Tax=Rhizophagus irregularis (strain DAOM 181602 / DAOM 197198 / MUCL 43194) TaxID=747089 RepID=A0A2P4P410_RHIID|nr:hypothetical protein GLOIN_2v1716436 [Rhizophagus irregularis DAOM 181602=DAOM 197198]POG60126.1 hypothetical protein GLOIN_2v1716436 [Rhizophagus irregularis DAOM 181602=DAOM 197198]|eukprot:XP_025166992.1 hypothetical protein GLOIN_2v1716436 [Rhizophagus irregularis DAOM 181602=DAOM 197198]